jgi:uncharacterized surface protein with fasciclin (FAS1) repeats
MKNIKLSLLGVVTSIVLLTASCNKDLEQFPDIVAQPATGPKLDQALQNNPDYSLYYALVVRGGQLSMINDSTKSFTMFVPGNNGVKQLISALSGGLVPVIAPDAVFLGVINSQIPVEQAAALVQYNTIPQLIKSTSIAPKFPNFFYPSALNPLPQASSLLRLGVCPSVINGAWFNNIPIVHPDEMASNGVIHQTATLSIPGQRTLWDRISSDTNLTYLKAAVERADSGAAPGATLKSYLNNESPNLTVFSPLTVFAPVDTAFRRTLRGLIRQGLIASGVPPQQAGQLANQLSSTPTVFTNPLLANALTPTRVKGILAYHVLGSKAYTNNFPTTTTEVPSLLSAFATHPGLKVTATFTPGNPFVSGMTVKDTSTNPNSRAANVIINSNPLTPDPSGTSDQDYLNGVLHYIDKVLLP